MLDVDQLKGLWRRSLLDYPNAPQDTTTQVRWLQGPTMYADLRQKQGRPSFAGVGCLRDVAPAHTGWLARQEAFAGILGRAGDWFEWKRDLDFQPRSATADAGRLRLEDGILKEVGRDIPYLEHWHREPIAATPAAGLRLRERGTETRGALIAVGSTFMYARGRAFDLPAGSLLSDLVAASPDLRAAQDLLDCEVSFGDRSCGTWRIAHSTLPFREGDALTLGADPGAGSTLTLDDRDADGRPTLRRWVVEDGEGDLESVWHALRGSAVRHVPEGRAARRAGAV